MKAGDNTYFFDTYALLEIYKGNSSYLPYTEARVIITILNLMELYHILLKETNKIIAESIFSKYLKSCIHFTPDDIKYAVEFRLKFISETKWKISYVDALGYIIAQKFNIKFLTGDQAFANLKNVEYVK